MVSDAGDVDISSILYIFIKGGLNYSGLGTIGKSGWRRNFVMFVFLELRILHDFTLMTMN